MTLSIFVCVDDYCPVRGKGLEQEEGNFKYLKKLNEEFGMKFSMFTIPIYKGIEQHDLRNNNEWVDWVKKQSFMELQNHGLTHTPIDKRFGSQEFMRLPYEEKLRRLTISKEIFESLGFETEVIRLPGWYVDKELYKIIKYLGLKAIADHSIGCRTFEKGNGLKVFPYTLSIDDLHSNHYDDLLILHSHFDDDNGHNKNYWNEENYNNVRSYIETLIEINGKENIEFKFLSELL